MDEWKRSGQIPAFGNWEHANEMPITQYFECARQAGLIRHSNSSGECDHHGSRGCGGGGGGDLYAANFKKTSRDLGPPRKTRVSRERNRVVSSSGSHVKEQKKQGKVCDVTVTQPPTKQHHHHHRPKFPAKAVDEDLYKIPPELLRSSKRKKMPGFFSCLVPACAS